jgi:hypothetical protein
MITAALGLDVSAWNKGIADAKAGIGSMVSSNLFQALGAAAAVAGVAIAGMYKAMQAGGELVDLSAQTGIAIDKLAVLQESFTQAGLAASDIQPVVSKLQKAIAGIGQDGASAITKFGISIADLQGLSPDEQLKAIGDRIMEIEDPARRAAASMEIFGKSGAKMLSLFTSGGMEEIARKVGTQAQLLRENAGVFDSVTDNIGMAGNKMQGFFVGMASRVVPQLADAIDRMAQIDLAPIGESLGEGIAISIELIDRMFKKLEEFTAITGKAKATQQTGGQAFMGMVGFGMGAGGQGLAETIAIAEQPTPESAMGLFDEIKADIAKKREEARKKFAPPELPPPGENNGLGLGSMGKGADVTAGLSSLAKMGATGGGGPVMQDPLAMRSVSIQEDIRNYMRDLVNIVKSPENLSIQSSGTGMVLAS